MSPIEKWKPKADSRRLCIFGALNSSLGKAHIIRHGRGGNFIHGCSSWREGVSYMCILGDIDALFPFLHENAP